MKQEVEELLFHVWLATLLKHLSLCAPSLVLVSHLALPVRRISSHTLAILLFFPTGNVSSIRINPFNFTPADHVLTITFVDVRGNMGSTEYNFTGQIRTGKKGASMWQLPSCCLCL